MKEKHEISIIYLFIYFILFYYYYFIYLFFFFFGVRVVLSVARLIVDNGGDFLRSFSPIRLLAVSGERICTSTG